MARSEIADEGGHAERGRSRRSLGSSRRGRGSVRMMRWWWLQHHVFLGVGWPGEACAEARNPTRDLSDQQLFSIFLFRQPHAVHHHHPLPLLPPSFETWSDSQPDACSPRQGDRHCSHPSSRQSIQLNLVALLASPRPRRLSPFTVCRSILRLNGGAAHLHVRLQATALPTTCMSV